MQHFITPRCMISAVFMGCYLMTGPSDATPTNDLDLIRRAHDLTGGQPKTFGLETGTGVVITSQGLILTGAHVVAGCNEIDVASPTITPRRVALVNSSNQADLATLSVEAKSPLPFIGFEPASGEVSDVTVLGYPKEGDLLKATKADGELLPETALPKQNTGVVWFKSETTTPGFSGGPIIEQLTGRVIGLEHGQLSPEMVRLRIGQSVNNVHLGEGKLMIDWFLDHWAVDYGSNKSMATVAPSLEVIAAATVHVFCWR